MPMWFYCVPFVYPRDIVKIILDLNDNVLIQNTLLEKTYLGK